jgi:ribosomal protein S18 acetylase RimI-like enzyme
MKNCVVGFRYCEWDSDFFGYRVAEMNAREASSHDVKEGLERLALEQTKLVYWRVAPDDEASNKAAEANGGFFAGTQVTYEQPNRSEPGEFRPGVSKFMGLEPNTQLYSLAVQSGLYSRYNNDKRISRQHFRELYEIWIRKCVTGEMGDGALVALRDNKPVGVVAMQLKRNENSLVSSISLIAVDEDYRGRGVGADLVASALTFGANAGCKHHSVVTYGENAAACGLLERFGYTPEVKQRFYHFWL